MRSADIAVRFGLRIGLQIGLLIGLCIGATGCASVGSLFQSVPLGGPAISASAPNAAAVPTPAPQAALAPPPASVAPPAVRAAAASPGAVAAPLPVPGATAANATPAANPTNATPATPGLPLVYGAEPDVAVSPAVQRAYDEARRLMRGGKADEAERGFRALAQSNPELGGPHANLGVLYRQAGKLPEAAAEGEKAVRANPKRAVFFNQLGITYREQGQFAKAREAYETAIGLDAAYASPHLNLGILHDLYLADGKRALELYDKYLALSPGGDAVVTKWVADLKNRKPSPVTVSQKEKE